MRVCVCGAGKQGTNFPFESQLLPWFIEVDSQEALCHVPFISVNTVAEGAILLDDYVLTERWKFSRRLVGLTAVC